MLSLQGRVALVTGGGRGIGRACAILFGRLGARVAVNYRSDGHAAEETVALAREAGAPEACALRADVSVHAEAGRLVAEAEAKLGPLDTLVANHGIWKRASLQEMTPEQWGETVRTNLD